MKISEEDDLISEINVTPLVDVMLILMIIFLITAPLLIKNLDVNLPSANGQSQKEMTSKVIMIKENGDLFLDNISLSKSDLKKNLSLLAKKDLLIKIAADKNCRYQDVASILSLVGEVGIVNVSFLTK
jgi:biopolymer transport protein ExbD